MGNNLMFTCTYHILAGKHVMEVVHRSRFSDTCRWAHGSTQSHCFPMGKEIPRKLPLIMGDPNPRLIHGYLGPPHPTCQTPSRSNQPSLHGSRSIIPILYYGTAPFPPQNCPLPWGDRDPHLIHGDCLPPHPTRQTASRSVQPFSQDT